MGRKSTKENKSVWQTTREGLGLTREKAGELIPGFSPERIEKIENGRTQIQPEDVMLLAEYYKSPSLRNYYCVNECPIGQVHALRTESKELAQIAVETLNSLNKLSKSRDRLLEIVEDGEVQADEYADFAEIKATLDRIALSVKPGSLRVRFLPETLVLIVKSSLRLWNLRCLVKVRSCVWSSGLAGLMRGAIKLKCALCLA